MIRFMQVKNFKSLYHFSKSFSRLNMLFGENSAGKSSIIQALLLMRQSYLDGAGGQMSVLKLNGHYLELGTVKDVMSQYSDDDYIRFVINFDNEGFDGKYKYGPSPTANTLKRESIVQDNIKGEALFGNDFLYLSADHIEPRRQYDIYNWDGTYCNIGIHGEYSVPFLAQYGDKIDVPEIVAIEGAKSIKLIDQVSAWMSRISYGTRLTAELNEMDQSAKLYIAYEGDRTVSNFFSPLNVGFGIPHVLPVVVGLLASRQNGLVLIENPESHLHPKAQAVIAELMARVAANGTQIICESHSDHIINGIRICVRNGVIDKKELSISYCRRNTRLETDICEIMTDDKGHLSDFPEGFLDEWGILMSELI